MLNEPIKPETVDNAVFTKVCDEPAPRPGSFVEVEIVDTDDYDLYARILKPE